MCGLPVATGSPRSQSRRALPGADGRVTPVPKGANMTNKEHNERHVAAQGRRRPSPMNHTQRAHSPQSIKPPEPFTVTTAEAQRLLGIGRSKFWTLVREGQTEMVTIGRRRLPTFASLKRLAARS